MDLLSELGKCNWEKVLLVSEPCDAVFVTQTEVIFNLKLILI